MADVTDVVIKMLDHQWAQAKQSEDQRSAMTNYVLFIAAALQGYIVQRNFDHFSLAVAIFLTLIGFYGAIFSYKYYERFRLAVSRVGRWMEKLEGMHTGSNLDAIERWADEKHKKRYPTLHRIRLHLLWLLFHSTIILVGIANIVLILIRWNNLAQNPVN